MHEVDEEAPKGLLGRSRTTVLSTQHRRHRRRRHRLRFVPRQRRCRGGAELGLGAGRVERGPRIVGVGVERLGQLEHLVAGQQRGVILGMALDRQRPTLDRVGEHHRRAVGVDGAVGLDQLGRIVTAEVAQGRAQLRVAELPDQPAKVPPSPGQTLPQLGGLRAQQPLVLLIGHLIDARPQFRPAAPLEQCFEPGAVLDRDRLPSRRLEHVGPSPEGDVGHHAVERLAVEVDHPQHLAQLGDAGIGDRLPDRALVELGVAHQGDLTAHRRGLQTVGLEIAPGHGAPDRRGGADSHRAGGVVDGVGVLGPARVALKPAEGAQRLEVGPVKAAEQVVDGMQRRRGVRFHRYAVLGAQLGEPERAHQAHHRRARGLVAAHLHATAVLAHAIGVVHDRARQPQHAPLNRPQRVEVRRCGLLRRRGRGR